MAFKRTQNSINMDRKNLDDPSYRYYMEKLKIVYEGKHTGQRTILKNIVHIASAIKTSTSNHLVSYLGKKLGSQNQFHKTRKEGIINGVHDISQLQSLIFDYIEEYSMCPACRLPAEFRANQSYKVCKACGYSKQNKRNNKKNKKAKKKKKKRKKKDKNQNNDDNKCNNDNNQITNPNIINNNNVQALSVSNPISSLNYYLKENINVSMSDIMEKIKILSIANKLDRKNQIKMVVYCLAKFNENDIHSLLLSFKKYSQIFESFTLLNSDSEIFLAYIEELIINRNIGNELLNKSYKIFWCLYEQDIITEDEINKWYNSSDDIFRIITYDDAQQIKNKTQPFIKWLQADDDNDD